MVCFMSFCAGTVSGKVWHSQRLNFICMCCSMWAGVVIQHDVMVCFMSFCAGTVSGKVWHSQRLNFICMCCSMWAGVVIQHEMSQSSVMQKLWSGLVPGVIRSVIDFISSHVHIVSNSFIPEIALDIFQTSVVCIRWLKWFTETGHVIIVTGQIHGCLCYYHTHTHNMPHSLWGWKSNKITASMSDQLLIFFLVYADLNW